MTYGNHSRDFHRATTSHSGQSAWMRGRASGPIIEARKPSLWRRIIEGLKV